MSTLKRVFTLRMKDDVFDKLEVIAKSEYRSLSNLIEFVLRDYIKRYEEKNGEIKAGEE